MATEDRVRAGRRTVVVPHPSRVLFPTDGITKRDLVSYYLAVAPWMLEHIRGRPLMVQRFPDGIDAGGFYQKQLGTTFPTWVARVEVPRREGGTILQAVGNDVAGLTALAAEACVSFHAWLSRSDHLEMPDRVVLDLDPPGTDFEMVRQTALTLRALLDELGLVPYVKTTGSRGLHVVAPILPRTGFDDVRAFARRLAEAAARRLPGLVTTEPRKADRGGRLYVDVMRNGYGQTAVAPYSLRARPGAPAATPIAWEELQDPALGPQTFKFADVPARLAQRGDPWAGMGQHARSLAEPRRRLEGLLGASSS